MSKGDSKRTEESCVEAGTLTARLLQPAFIPRCYFKSWRWLAAVRTNKENASKEFAERIPVTESRSIRSSKTSVLSDSRTNRKDCIGFAIVLYYHTNVISLLLPPISSARERNSSTGNLANNRKKKKKAASQCHFESGRRTIDRSRSSIRFSV